MQRILLYGDSNLWGFLPIDFAAGKLERLPLSETWAGIAGAQLAGKIEIIVDALPGRTLGVDRPDMAAGRSLPSHAWNGLTELPAAMVRHAPFNGVVLALGTNDLLMDSDIATEAYLDRVLALVQAIRDFRLPLPLRGMEEPVRVVVMAMHGFGPTPTNPPGSANGERAELKRAQLVEPLKHFAAGNQCSFINAAEAVPTLGGDGVHLDRDAHQRLGVLMGDCLTDIFSLKREQAAVERGVRQNELQRPN